MKHSEKAVRQRMRERGVKTDASTVAAVMREVNASERERSMRREAARSGFAVERCGRKDAREEGARIAARVRRDLRGGEVV